MKKRIWRKDGMKQIINSGWKLFDKQTNCITTGNAFCNTQTSSYIRPWNEIECNGFEFSQGHLLKFDLQNFGRHCIPEHIHDILFNEERTESVILYMFHIYNKEKRIEPFCWVVTGKDQKLISWSIVCGYKKSFQKRYGAAKEAISYITN